MQAVVEIAGKQFRVAKDQKVKVPLLNADSGSKVEFDRVLSFTNDEGKTEFGQPLVKAMKVSATVVEHGRDKKIIVFKKKRRKGYQKKNGHRQDFSLITIDDIAVVKTTKKAETKAKAEAAPEAKAETKAPAAKKETAAKKAAPKKTTTTKKATTAKKEAKPKTETKAKAAPKKAAPKKTAAKKENKEA